MSFENLPYHELDRQHQQGKRAKFLAVLRGDEQAYRAADALERKTRREKIRRAAQREGRV